MAELKSLLADSLDKMASSEVVDFLRGRKSRALIAKLKAAMLSINEVLSDAELKQSEDPAVRFWLLALKDLIYDADDLLDEIAYEALRSKSEVGSQLRKLKVRASFSSINLFKKGIGAKMEGIVERFCYLATEKFFFNMVKETSSKLSIPTTCLVDDSGIYGRNDEKEAILKLVLSDYGDVIGPSILPIVGMGGLGKTTLAQLVYNDMRVQMRFDVKVWVCVSDDFDILRLTKAILEGVTGRNCETKTANQLQLDLKEALMGKRYLLVLDDVWNEDYAAWENLRKPLKFGARGSMIIITTRNMQVASMLSTGPVYRLNSLTAYDSWSLLASYAFHDRKFEATPELEYIGRQIATRCHGLPLALKMLGCLLRFRRETAEWEEILKSLACISGDRIGDDILSSLKLSYDYLPSHLKRCFAYCAILPPHYEFEQEELVVLWMAEGFLHQPDRSQGSKEVGDSYFHELVSMSYFQSSTGYNRSCYVMHDLMHDLAQHVSGEFCLRMEAGASRKISQRIRHLSYARSNDDGPVKFEAIFNCRALRTLLPMDWPRLQPSACIDSEVINRLILKLSSLRVLSLSQYVNVDVLPDAISKLKHLRYLDCSKTSISSLPEYICNLYNLQVLILFGCVRLTELPNGMSRLVNLCHLDIRGTKIRGMPSQMGNLANLEKLTDFIVGSQLGSTIKELGKLKHIQGELCIHNLENVMDAEDALGANLKDKRHLKVLELRWNVDANNSCHGKDVLECLQPHTSIECLIINGYGAKEFPSWVGDSSFKNIVVLELNGSKCCSSLPPFGQLASLKDLSFAMFGNVVVIGPEFYGSCLPMKKPFGLLEVLRFRQMPQWREWISYIDGDVGAFPLLRELHITECPKLMEALPSHLPALRRLEIKECQQLVASFPLASAILRMSVIDDSRDVLLEKLPSGLHHLRIGRFLPLDPILEGMEQMGCLSVTLEEMEIMNCASLKCFPIELFPNLRSLQLSRLPNLKSLFASDFPSEDFNSNLKFFPNKARPTSTLATLKIWDLQNLESLEYNGFPKLTSLRELEIGDCPKLLSLPKDGLPSSLSLLSIWRCPLLEHRCQRKTGEDWPKISYIPSIKINFTISIGAED